MPTESQQETYRRMLHQHLPGVLHEQEFYAQKLQQLCRPGIAWLDAGCGHSLVPEWLKGAQQIERSLLDQARLLVGCDVDYASLNAPSRIRRIACNLEHLAFADETFDLVSANMVVEHLGEPETVFAEIFRVLRPGGKAIFLTPNFYHWTTIAAWLTPHWFHQWAIQRLEGRKEADVFPTRYRCNTSKAFYKLLGHAGFGGVQVDALVCRPRLMRFPLLLPLEFRLYRMTQRFPQLREVLCVTVGKPSGPRARQVTA